MLTLDYAGCLSTRVGDHGLHPDLLSTASEPGHNAARCTRALAETRGTGWERWRDLPFDPLRKQHVNAVRELAASTQPACDNLVVLGIGGSALGNTALQAALNPPTYNLLPREQRPGPRIFILDNVDPAHFAAHMDLIRAQDPSLQRTVFNVISKSGETAETAAQFMWARGALRDAGRKLSEHVVAITDPDKGTMRRICDEQNIPTLPVPDGVGGRFSVLSPVGLFSAAVAGIDIELLLDGAAEMDERCRAEDITKNPAAMLATLLVELGNRGKHNHVLMPYANALYPLADWFRQLWAESLGKQKDLDNKNVYAGYTPIKALGATDQHSQIQLYREGPNDKVIGLISAGDWRDDHVQIPSGFGVESLQYLENASMGALLESERRATEFALVESQRPNFTIRMDKIDAWHVGAFIQLWEIATAYAGLLLRIDPYNQPAVETGKVATFGLMGRQGYEDWKKKVDDALPPTDHVVR